MTPSLLIRKMYRPLYGGYLTLLTLIFGSIFIGILGALSSYILTENRLLSVKYSLAQAFTIAEAGIEYYRWYLAHYPGDTTHGTGNPGPFTVSFEDPEGGVAGEITLTASGSFSCGEATFIDLESEGTPTGSPQEEKTVYARYAQSSVGTYSYILNDSVWAGDDRVILGPYHSNGGIRMDGTSNAPVTSSLTTWNCTSNHGCTPSQPNAPGVTGNGTNQNLWDYPVPQVDFAAISADFNNLKTTASTSGLYLPRYSSGSKSQSQYWRGYHLIFNTNGTVTVRRVNSTNELTPSARVNSADTTDGVRDRILITGETLYTTYTLSTNCPLIFVEDNTWIEGTIPSKVTVVVANVADVGVDPSAYLRNSIVYASVDGSDGLTVIAERNVLIAPDAPQDMTLNGIFIAQSGAFGMNAYACSSGYAVKDELSILGTTVSNKRTGTKWTNTCSGNNVGFQTRIDSYDRSIASAPPPFTPIVSTDYKLMDWREK